MRILDRQEQRAQQKKREARTKAYNRRIAKEGLITQAIIENEVNQIAARNQFIKALKDMLKTTTKNPKKFSKRTDAYTAWLITFGHRGVSKEDVEQWGMWEVYEKLAFGYMRVDIKTGKAKLKTLEEINP